ncbi:MAG: S8 family serine peptidase [Candidatus Eisenbacteria bacterium]
MRLATKLPLVLAIGLMACATSAHAYVDLNANRIDDRIERVHVVGWNAAFENDDPTQRMSIGVENAAEIRYAVYVMYDHKPVEFDRTTLLATGVSMAWPFTYIPYIETHASWAQVALISNLPGVTRVEAIPVEYATNHYATRVLRARDARGLTQAEAYELFPNARQHLGLDGNGIVIAILDTGVNDDVDQFIAGYPGHESLHGKFLGGGEFFCGNSLCTTPFTSSVNPQDHGSEASSYHATHVAGTAMGTGGPGGFFAGVAPAARLVDCKVLSDAGASVGGSNRGLEWAIANRRTLWAGLSPGSIWQGIDVVSMSLGSTECAGGSGTSNGASSTLVGVAVDSGLVVAIATGNDGSTNCISSPAAADKSIAVGASTHNRTINRADDQVTSFSNEGPRTDDGDADHFDEMKPSVVAPGAGIISAFGDPTSDGSEYQQLSGTSMATPCVAGCIALILQANPALTPMQVRSILQNTAEHNVPTSKVSGDRGQDPYGLDANYDPSCGWGLVDVYAAGKEALNSASGVQVVQVKGTALPANGRIDFQWYTQREFPFLGFNVYRAPDAGGAPGPFVQLNTLPIAPSGHSGIQGLSNRTLYTYPDNSPALALGQTYWYRVDWIDLTSAAHQEPPVPVAYGTLARIATAYYRIVHNAVDNDLLVRLGSDLNYDPGTLGAANFEVLGPGEGSQDSAVVILPAAVPANTGTSTLGTIEHYWSVGFRQGDGAEPYLPPTMAHPWFLRVVEAGYVNRQGRVTAFSLFVNNSPGSAGGTTYVTDHQPMPQPTVEGGAVPVTLWIPEQQATPAKIAYFEGTSEAGGNRLSLELATEMPGARAMVYRSSTDDFATRQPLTAQAIPVEGTRFEYLDAQVSAGATYSYWVELLDGNGGSIMNGPVTMAAGGVQLASVVLAPRPNPFASSTVLQYTLGADRAPSGSALVSVVVHDSRGRVVRTIKHEVETAGPHQAEWNGEDDRGARVAAGVYHVSFRAGSSLIKNLKLAVVR